MRLVSKAVCTPITLRLNPVQQHPIRLLTSQLQCGMFVVELDRPWLETPFGLQGVLAESDADIQTFRRLCKFVYVDPERSTIPIPGAAKVTVEKSVPRRARNAGPKTLTMKEVDAGSAIAQRLDPSAGRISSNEPNKMFAPPGVRLVNYPTQVPLSRELPRARQAYQRAAQTVTQLVRDIAGIGGLPISEIEDVVPELVESVIANPDALMWMTRMRGTHDELYGHSLRTGIYMLILGRHLGFPPAELKQLAMIGLLIDIGKIQLPPALLAKQGNYTEAERIVVRKHVQFGLDMLADTENIPEPVYVGIAHHHERIDGTGYPFGLRADEVSIYGRMAGIVDSFAAMIVTRPYAKARTPGDALMNLLSVGGKGLDSALIEQFIQAIGIFPVGSLVELSTGELALVVRHNRAHRLRPRLLVLTDRKKEKRTTPVELDLSDQQSPAGARQIQIVRGMQDGAIGLDEAMLVGSTPESLLLASETE